ncbi:Uncharacterised protein [uncultured archaeon]|nr:Uncharacterised protein [uncultured archaeon]
MVSEHRVNILKPGTVFRDWLLDVLGDRIHNKDCDVVVYKIKGASHNVCRYHFKGEGYSVVAKFYAEPTGWLRHYDAVESMEREFRTLKKIESIIDIPRPLAIKREFDCVLLTEYTHGKSLYSYMKAEKDLYSKLTAVAHLLRMLHDQTRSEYLKDLEFAHFHKVLDQLKLHPTRREMFNRLLGDWWYRRDWDSQQGCLIHNDENPVNYVFKHDKIYALDFESAWEHAHAVHDLGTVAAELKNHFEFIEKNRERSEQYIGHFIWNYSSDESEFHWITRALPFFIGLGLLRMARLDLGAEHRDYIFKEAEACLRAKQ